MKCTELVFQDHATIRRGLDILDSIVAKLEQGERIEISDAITVLKFIRIFGLDYHQAMEEQVLFPALHETRIEDLTFEHEEHRSLMNGIDEALGTKRGLEFVRRSRGFIALLRNHLNREDAILRNFPEGGLSMEQDEAVVSEFAKGRMPPEQYGSLSRLEWKYGMRAHGTTEIAGRELVRARGAD